VGQQGRPRSSSHHIIHQPCRADGVLPEHLTVCQMPESRSKVQTSLRSMPSAARPPNTNAFSRMAAHACPERGAGRSAAEPFCWGVNHFMVSVLKTATSDVVLSHLRPAIVRTCVHRVPISCMRKYYRRIFRWTDFGASDDSATLCPYRREEPRRARPVPHACLYVENGHLSP